MKFMQSTVSSLLLVSATLTTAQAQNIPGLDFIPPIFPNFAAFDIFGLVEFLKNSDLFGFFPTFVNNGCQTLNSVEDFDSEDFFSRPYFAQFVQEGEQFNTADSLNCVVNDNILRDDLPLGYTIGANNFALFDNGEISGVTDIDPILLCLVPTPANPSKFLSNVCFVPPFLGIDLWVVANEPDYVIFTSGQTTLNTGNGCINDLSGFDAGVIIGTPETFPSQATLDAAFAKARELGIDPDALVRVDQDNSDTGPPCNTFTTPRGVPFDDPPCTNCP